MKYVGTLFLTLLLSLFSAEAFGLEVSDIFLEEPRKKLEEKGLFFEAVYAGDMVSNLEGGLHHKTTYLGNLDLALTVDLGQAGLIPGGKIYVSGNNTHGGENPTERYIGDLQGVDNIEAPDSMRLYEWWYEQNLFDDKFSVLTGVYGLDSEFAVTEYGCLLIHSSFGTPPDISANIPAPIFPFPGPAARIKIKPHEQFEFLAGIFDGDPTDGGKNRHNVNYRLSSHQGVMMVFEAAYHPKFHFDLSDVYHRCLHPISRMHKQEPRGGESLSGSIKFGSWIHTQDINDTLATNDAGDPIRYNNNYGFYGIAEQMIYQERLGEDQGLGIFFQFGGAPDNRNTVDYYFGAGMNYKGLIPKRDQDTLGIAVANAFLSGSLRRARDLEIASYDPEDPEAGDPPRKMTSNESALEMTYRIQLNERLALQPDYQIVFNPSGEENAKTAHVFLLRFEITF